MGGRRCEFQGRQHQVMPCARASRRALKLTCCVPVSEVLAVPLSLCRELNLPSVTAVRSAAACSWSPEKGDKGGLTLSALCVTPS